MFSTQTIVAALYKDRLEQYEIEAHQHHMQLLALFPGTLMFIDRPTTINSETTIHSS